MVGERALRDALLAGAGLGLRLSAGVGPQAVIGDWVRLLGFGRSGGSLGGRHQRGNGILDTVRRVESEVLCKRLTASGFLVAENCLDARLGIGGDLGGVDCSGWGLARRVRYRHGGLLGLTAQPL